MFIFMVLVSCSNFSVNNLLKIGISELEDLFALSSKPDIEQTKKSLAYEKITSWSANKDDWLSKDVFCRNKIMIILGNMHLTHKDLALTLINNVIEFIKEDPCKINLFDTPDIDGFRTFDYYVSSNLLDYVATFLDAGKDEEHNFAISEISLMKGISIKAALPIRLFGVNLSEFLKPIIARDPSFLESPVDDLGNFLEHVCVLCSNIDFLKFVLDSRIIGNFEFIITNHEHQREYLFRANINSIDPLALAIRYCRNDVFNFLLDYKYAESGTELSWTNPNSSDIPEHILRYLKEMALFAVHCNNFYAAQKILSFNEKIPSYKINSSLRVKSLNILNNQKFQLAASSFDFLSGMLSTGKPGYLVSFLTSKLKTNLEKLSNIVFDYTSNEIKLLENKAAELIFDATITAEKIKQWCTDSQKSIANVLSTKKYKSRFSRKGDVVISTMRNITHLSLSTEKFVISKSSSMFKFNEDFFKDSSCSQENKALMESKLLNLQQIITQVSENQILSDYIKELIRNWHADFNSLVRSVESLLGGIS